MMNSDRYKRMMELEALNDAKPLPYEAMGELWELRYVWWQLPDDLRSIVATEGDKDATS